MTISPWTFTPEGDVTIWCPEEFDLSGSDISIPIIVNQELLELWGNNNTASLVIKKWFIAYTEATPGSTDATYDFLMRLGTNANASQHHDYTIPANKAVGDVDYIDGSAFAGEDRIFNTVNWTQIRCIGGASGAGRVRAGIIVTADGTQWRNFTP